MQAIKVYLLWILNIPAYDKTKKFSDKTRATEKADNIDGKLKVFSNLNFKNSK